MRITSTKELETLYNDLEGLQLYPSISYISLVKSFKETNTYLSELRADLRLYPNKATLVLWIKFPDEYISIVFKEDFKS